MYYILYTIYYILFFHIAVIKKKKNNYNTLLIKYTIFKGCKVIINTPPYIFRYERAEETNLFTKSLFFKVDLFYKNRIKKN
jgi:hypothetical protein